MILMEIGNLMKRVCIFVCLVLAALAVADPIEIIRTGGVGFNCVRVTTAGDEIVSEHFSEYKAIAACQSAQLEDQESEYNVVAVGRLRLIFSEALAQTYPGTNNSLPEGEGEPPNEPPVWNTTPAPVFTEGVVGSYDLAQHFSDPEGDTLAIVNEAGCTLPVGVAIDDPNNELDEDGTSPAATTTSCIFSIDDSSNPAVDSSAFSIVVSAIPLVGTIYERDMLGVPRTGTSGAVEPVSAGGHTGNPVTELNWVLEIDEADYACDATVATGDSDWTTKVNDNAFDNVCIDAGDHSSKDTMVITDGGAAGTTRTISAITLNDPVRVDFTAAHGWTTGDIIHCDDAAGGTWQMRWRYFKVTVIDTDTVDLDGQDGTGTGTRPAWAAYTSGGTCQAPTFKVIRHSTDLSAHPATLASGSRAKVMRVDIGASGASIDYVMLLGLSLDHKGLDGTIGSTGNRLFAADYVILDNVHDYNDEALGANFLDDFQKGGLTIQNASGDTTAQYIHIQRTFFDQRGNNGSQDTSYLPIITTEGRAIRLINSESSSAMSTWQISGGNSSSYEGFTFAGNSDWLDTSIYTDCAGNVVGGTTFGALDSSLCAVAESAGAFKDVMGGEGRLLVTNANRHRLILFDANMQGGRRTEDGVLSDGGSGGQSYGFSSELSGADSMRNILWRNNVIYANERGLPQGYGFNRSSTIEYQSIIGNINYDITYGSPSFEAQVWAWFGKETDNNQFDEFIFNTIVTATAWGNFRRIENTTLECNLIIDGGSRLNAIEASFTQKNNYGYGTTANFDGTGDTLGGAVSLANMADLIIKPKLHSDSSFEFTLSDVLSTSTSPHAADCPDIGSPSGRGVSDATVTF